MKKIVFYIGSLARGGAQRVISTLANALVRDGYNCIVATSYKADSEYKLDERVKRIVLIENSKKRFYKDNFIQIFKLRKILQAESPDSIVSFMGEPNIRMIISSIGLQCKKIISIRNDPAREYPNRLYRYLAKTLFRFADAIVFQTEDARRWFPKSIQCKSCVILNPIDDVFFNNHFNGERHNIVTTGRLVSQKNHKLLIKAFALIADQIEDNLYIYGEGSLRFELERLISNLNMRDRIFLPGSIKNVPETIKSAKLFVLSSNYEGLPNSLMEAIALGIPSISTDCPCGGPKMLLKSEALVKVGDEKELSQKMLEFLTKETFENFYDVKKIYGISEIINLWKNVFFYNN